VIEVKSQSQRSDQPNTEIEGVTQPDINYSDKIIYEFKTLFNDSRYSNYYTITFAIVTLCEIIFVSLMNSVRMGQYLCLLGF
jgi:hypothetical protein